MGSMRSGSCSTARRTGASTRSPAGRSAATSTRPRDIRPHRGAPDRGASDARPHSRTPRATSLSQVLAARVRLTLIALTACALAAVIGVSIAVSERTSPGELALSNGWAGAQRPSGQRVPDFALSDQDGKTITSAALKGKPVVFAFVY